MTRSALNYALFLSFCICSFVGSEKPLHLHRPDTEPDIDFRPAYEMPQPVTTPRSHHHSHHGFRDFSDLPYPWHTGPQTGTEEYEIYENMTDYEYSTTETDRIESGDYETTTDRVEVGVEVHELAHDVEGGQEAMKGPTCGATGIKLLVPMLLASLSALLLI